MLYCYPPLMESTGNRAMPTCPECEAEGALRELQTEGSWETDWYGRITYYICPTCRERFVQQDEGEVAIAAE
jgi:transposase-like protein